MRDAFSVITAIDEQLFAAEERRLARATDALCEANQEAHGGSPSDGFRFQGRAYRHSLTPPGGRNFTSLHLSLWDRMTAHVADQQRLEDDRASVKQLLFRLIEPCTCEQHVRDAVPDCVADLLPEPYLSLGRMGSPTGSIHDPRLMRQYQKTLPKIEEYAATRLIF